MPFFTRVPRSPAPPGKAGDGDDGSTNGVRDDEAPDGCSEANADLATNSAAAVVATGASPDGAATDTATADADGAGRAARLSIAADGGREGGAPDGADDRGPDEADDVAAPGRRRVLLIRAFTALAVLLIAFALIAPNRLDRLTPAAFVRVPVEAIAVVALVLVLPARLRRAVAALAGVAFGLLAILKIFDIGFYNVLSRPFEPAFDWTLLPPAVDYVTKTAGRAAAIGAAIGAVVLAIAVVVLTTLGVVRLARLLARHRAAAGGAAVALGVVWTVCALTGAQLVPGAPVATVALHRPFQIRTPQDQSEFAAEAAKDPFRHSPGDRLLSALRGKDVILAFVESYGRVAIEDPELGPRVRAVLDAGTERLRKAGYTARSGYLRSPTTGGVSWLAHATLLSGMWIDNQRRYDQLVKTDRLTLNGAFRRANWRTVGVMPGVTKAWTEASFFGYDRVYAAKDLGYRGPVFSWSPMPDQFALSVFQRAERAEKHAPLMAEIPLTSTHSPWAPIPKFIDWDELGDGSVFKEHAATGRRPDVVWRDPAKVRNEYRRSVEYSLTTLISYVEKYGGEDFVLIFLGDHQPYSIVTGPNAGWDVPISIVSDDPAVLDRISGWGWHEGLKPGPTAPVWRMDRFRDRFLTAFGSQPATGRAQPPQAD